MRNLFFGPTTPVSPAADAGLLIIRLFAGLALALAHGWGKIPPAEGFISRIGGMGFPAPELFAWGVVLAEVGGGFLLALGLLTRPAALLVVIHFTIVVLIAHAGDTFDDRELAMFFGVTALMLLLTGPGRYSLDAMIAQGRRSRR
jgi:putative oxidoreductase